MKNPFATLFMIIALITANWFRRSRARICERKSKQKAQDLQQLEKQFLAQRQRTGAYAEFLSQGTRPIVYAAQIST